MADCDGVSCVRGALSTTGYRFASQTSASTCTLAGRSVIITSFVRSRYIREYALLKTSVKFVHPTGSFYVQTGGSNLMHNSEEKQ